MLPWNVRTEFLKNYFQKGAWLSSHDPVNCMALSARPKRLELQNGWSYTVYGLQICVSSDKARIGNWTQRIVWSGDQRRHVTSRSRSRSGYLTLNVWTIEQYRANCSNGTDTAFHRTYSCCRRSFNCLMIKWIFSCIQSIALELWLFFLDRSWNMISRV